uniref:Lipase_3 domain-containing protein n=1 Tax=Angiostrongylus cantonensis TaxID=6313 RepID=A0A0K0DG85_ANGCA
MHVPCLLACLALIKALPFLGKRTNYDETTARKLLNMAAGAYGDQQAACLNRTFQSSDAYVVLSTAKAQSVSDMKKELTVVFRGTKTKGQLLLEGLHSIHPGIDFFGMGNVNRYFMNGHLALWSMVEQVLRDPKYAGYRVTFTGHSLGGALAALAAARTAKQGYRTGGQLSIYTFGEPRVGDANFALNFDNLITNSYRVVFRRDIVPHLPPCAKDKTWFGDGDVSRPCDFNAKSQPYHHRTEIWYPDSMEPGSLYVECVGEPKGEDFACSDKIKLPYDQMNSYIWDHRHYFTVRVPEYGKTGCDLTQPEGKPSILEHVVNRIKTLTRTIGLE